MESLDKQTETTRTRIAALEHIHAKYNCRNTILWLSDRSRGVEELLCSYHIGESAVRSSLAGTALTGRPLASNMTGRDLLAAVQGRVVETIGDDQVISTIALGRANGVLPQPDPADLPVLGVLVLQHEEELDEAEMDQISNDISNVVEFTRLNRLATCVTNAQTFLADTSKDVASFLGEIGFFMVSQLNARRYMYINTNRADGWREIEGDSLAELDSRAAERDFEIEEVGPCRPGQIRQVDLRFPRSEVGSPAILVPVPQTGFVLKPVPFAKYNEFPRSLPRAPTDDIRLLFFEKSVDGYLQNRFSESDVAIANAFFGFVAKYIESIIFENNASEVIRHLDTDHMAQDNAASVLKILERISNKFKSTTILRAGRFESSIDFEKISETDDVIGLDKYLKKIRETYFRSFYERRTQGNSDHPYFGVDRIGDRLYFEVHFPRYNSESRIYLVGFDGDTISESAFRSLVNLFSDLYSRVMREENIRERGSYLMQVRHAVIHHFSAANRSLKSLRPLWERGQRDKDYWLDLLSDPLIGSELARTIGSLGQANLIIENGRFMIGDLDPSALNRKPYRIADLVNSTLEILKYSRDDKRIGVISKITGPPPKSMRGDGPLLSIALMNLFDNAIKYSPHFAKIRWRLDFLGDRYRLAISSVGDRLDPNARHMLFQEGYRGFQSDRLNRRHGTGLGLPVAYRILEAHSPRAQLSFEPFEFDAELEGSGNTFFFEMPYFSGSTARAAAEHNLRD